MTSQPFKIALVGVGKIAHDQHVPSIAGNPDFELAATVSRHGSVDGVEAYTDLAAMLAKRPDIGAVRCACRRRPATATPSRRSPPAATSCSKSRPAPR
jgi:hypothetical protein